MCRLVVVKPVAEAGMAVPGFDRQVAVAQDHPFDRNAEPPPIARDDLDLGRHRAARNEPDRAAAGRYLEAVGQAGNRQRRHNSAVDNEVQFGVEVARISEALGALQQRGADRGQLGRTRLPPRRAEIPGRALVARVERGEFAGVLDHEAVVAIDISLGRRAIGKYDAVSLQLDLEISTPYYR